MEFMKQEIHPKALTGAKLKSIDKHGDFIFSSDDGMWKIPPNMLVGISDRDVYATGKLVRFTKNGKDKYQWIEDVEEQPATVKETSKPRNHLSNSIVGRLLKKGKVSK